MTVNSFLWRSSRELFPFEYGAHVMADRRWFSGNSNYAVDIKNVTGPPQAYLEARVLVIAPGQVGRALEIDLSCVTRVFRGCTGFDELVPSAWTDYELQHKGGRDIYWNPAEFGPEVRSVWILAGGTVFVGTFAVISALLQRFRPEKEISRR